MTQIKIFKNQYSDFLEEEVNTFLESFTEPYHVVDIKYTMNIDESDNCYSVLIVYTKPSKEEIIPNPLP